MKTFSLGEMAAHLLTVGADVELAKDVIVTRAARMVQRKAKSFMGHNHAWWPALAASTIEDKTSHGWPTPSPELRSGELRDSIEMTAPVHEAGGVVAGYVGSNSDIAVYQELGTSKMPPRSFIGAAAMQKEADIHKMAGDVVFRTMTSGGKNYHELMRVLHTLERAGHKLEGFLPEEENDEGEGR